MNHPENAPLSGRPMPGPPKPVAPTPPTPLERPVAISGESGSTTAPETGDIVVDAALRDLAAVDDTDLDATLAAGESVHATLTARLSDLGT